jgi:hypothetical protein
MPSGFLLESACPSCADAVRSEWIRRGANGELRLNGVAQGTYRRLLHGRLSTSQDPLMTPWQFLLWGAVIPRGASITVRARAGNGAGSFADLDGVPWLPPSPLCAYDLRPLAPMPWHYCDGDEAATLEIEFTFTASPAGESPGLEWFNAGFVGDSCTVG